MTISSPLVIDYFSDVLCVWAWISQRRVEELHRQFGDNIIIKPRFIDIFGNVEHKMTTNWQNKGGLDAFAKHVHNAASNFEHVGIHPDLWQVNVPTTSANAHLMIKAVDLVAGEQIAQQYALAVRKAFYLSAQDISDMSVLLDLLTQFKLEQSSISEVLNNGTALASLMTDQQLAKKDQVKGSPTFVMDNGRQSLFGNVGYRVLQANVEELLANHECEASWC